MINNFFEPAHIFQYLCLFLAGIVAYHSGWFDRWSKKVGRTWRIVSVVCILLWPVMIFAGGGLNTNGSIFFGGSSWQALAYAFWESFICVGLCVGLLTGFRDILNQHHPVLESMATVAFTVYLIHAPIITFMQRYLGGMRLYPMIKFGLVTVIGVPLCFLIAGVLRKIPFFNKIL
jgi:surface polysaccharide O-acyltransferase-like enzyme